MRRPPKTRSLLGVLAALAVAFAPALAQPGLAQAQPQLTPYEEQLPPTAAPPSNVLNYGTTVRPDGTPIAVFVSAGQGGRLNVIDLNDATATADAFARSDVDVQPWGFATASDSTVLIGAANHLYRYDPRDDSVKVLSDDSIPGYRDVKGRFSLIWDITIGDDGTAYLATSTREGEGGYVLTYSDRAGWGRLAGGAPVERGQLTVRSIAHEAGKVYVGIGPRTPKIYEIDVASGTRRQVQLPGGTFTKPGMVSRLEVQGGMLYVGHVAAAEATTALNLSTGKSHVWPGVESDVITRPGEERKVYYWAGESQSRATLWEYDPDTDSHVRVVQNRNLLRRLSPASWATHDLLVSSDFNGSGVSIYRARTSRVTRHDGLIAPGRREFQSLIAAENGRLYGDWYMTSQRLVEITPAASLEGTTSRLLQSPNGQSEGMGTVGDHLITGLYQGARIAFHTLPDATFAPPIALPAPQDRPYAITRTTGEQFAVGTVPADGHLGGAIAFVDAGTGKFVQAEIDGVTKDAIYEFSTLKYADGVPTDLLSQQSPISLAHRDGKLYIGTTIRGGHTDRARTGGALQEAHLVVFDINRGVVTKVVNPFPGQGQRAINSLVFDEAGNLYGTTGSHVFRADPETLGIIASHDVAPASRENVNRTWTVLRDGRLFSIIGGQLYAVPTGDLGAAELIANRQAGPVATLTHGKDGYLYYTRGAEVYRNSYLLRGGPRPADGER